MNLPRIAMFLLLSGVMSACRGTFLTQVEAGYMASPPASGIEHGGVVAAHIGGSQARNLGYGLSARARLMENAWAIPEVGLHGFCLFENDSPVAFYLRAHPFVGLGGHQGDVRAMFSAGASAGLLVYPGTDASAFSLSLAGDYTVAPSFVAESDPYRRGWMAVQLGMAIGGVK